jgi:hypothetical protein
MKAPPLADQKVLLLAYCQKLVPKIALIGLAANHLGWWATLPGTELLLDELVTEGKLRYATKAELSKQDIRHGYLPV